MADPCGGPEKPGGGGSTDATILHQQSILVHDVSASCRKRMQPAFGGFTINVITIFMIATTCRHNPIESFPVSCQLDLTPGAAQHRSERGQHNTINDKPKFRVSDRISLKRHCHSGSCWTGGVCQWARSVDVSPLLTLLRNLLEDLPYVRALVQAIREGSETAGGDAEVGRSTPLAVVLEELDAWSSWWALCDCVLVV